MSVKTDDLKPFVLALVLKCQNAEMLIQVMNLLVPDVLPIDSDNNELPSPVATMAKSPVRAAHRKRGIRQLLNNEEKAEIIRLRRAGETRTAIAQKICRSLSAIDNVLHKNNLTKKSRTKKRRVTSKGRVG